MGNDRGASIGNGECQSGNSGSSAYNGNGPPASVDGTLLNDWHWWYMV